MSRSVDFAFPLDTRGGPEHGLTIREYFAAAALQGMCANGLEDVKVENPADASGLVAMSAVVLADALIAALAETNKGQP